MPDRHAPLYQSPTVYYNAGTDYGASAGTPTSFHIALSGWPARECLLSKYRILVVWGGAREAGNKFGDKFPFRLLLLLHLMLELCSLLFSSTSFRHRVFSRRRPPRDHTSRALAGIPPFARPRACVMKICSLFRDSADPFRLPAPATTFHRSTLSTLLLSSSHKVEIVHTRYTPLYVHSTVVRAGQASAVRCEDFSPCLERRQLRYVAD